MKTLVSFIILTIVTISKSQSQETVSEISGSRGTFYGLTISAEPKDLEKVFGPPTLTAAQEGVQIYGYGQRHLFIFRNKRLETVLITDSSHVYEIKEWIRPIHSLDAITYRVEPGITEEMLWADAIKILNEKGIKYRTTGRSGLNEPAIIFRSKHFLVSVFFTEYTSGALAVTDLRIDIVSGN